MSNNICKGVTSGIPNRSGVLSKIDHYEKYEKFKKYVYHNMVRGITREPVKGTVQKFVDPMTCIFK